MVQLVNNGFYSLELSPTLIFWRIFKCEKPLLPQERAYFTLEWTLRYVSKDFSQGAIDFFRRK